MVNIKNSNSRREFPTTNGTLREHIEWNYEIRFEYNGSEYNIEYENGGKPILTRFVDKMRNKEIVVSAENAQEFLQKEYNGITIERIINDFADVVAIG